MLGKMLDSVYFWLLMYFATNLGLTIYNKAVLQFANFHFPWLLTGIHCIFSFIGAFIFVRLSSKETLSPSEFRPSRGTMTLLAFSVLYTVNIAVSNISLDLVSLAFHQLIRSTTPFFAVILSLVFRIKTFSLQIYLALVPVVLGVILATYGDLSFSLWGMILTVLGTALAAIKTIATNIVLVGPLKLAPMELLSRMSFLAFFQCLAFAYVAGEIDKLPEFLENADGDVYLALAGNGVMAFLLNYASFTTNKLSSALTMTVAANVKQVLAIILAIIVFHTAVTPLNVFGIFVTLAGGVRYTMVEYREKEDKKKDHLPTSNK